MTNEKMTNEKNFKKPYARKSDRDYGYYSRVLNKPFDSIEELRAAEEAHLKEIRAKEDKVAQKKADAQKVEDAFKALNAARKVYKDNLLALTERYSKDLQEMKAAFEQNKHDEQRVLAEAEENYSKALKEFTSKYDSYHVTLKDGDFETTISGSQTKNLKKEDTNLLNLFDLLFSL